MEWRLHTTTSASDNARMTNPRRRPGDDILDRYVPHLSGSDRELARERLQKLVALLARIAVRQVREESEKGDSRKTGFEGRIPPTPPSVP